MATRDAFLDRVRREMAKTPGLFAASPGPRPADPVREAVAIRSRARAQAEALLARFRAEAEAVGAVVHRVSTVEEAAEVVLGLATARAARRVATWRRSRLGAVSGVATRLAEAGLEVFDGAPEPGAGPGPSAPIVRVAAAEIGLTAADLA
ncbi:MAG: hypothetical protein HY359_05820, partial [Candidatus Rokubacteria bacterium]|nr:hypothetical protein [Candidatus Rokubacteria bacterium]